LLFSAFAATAQTNFKPGYILNTNKDTVKGYLDYREWGKNPRQVMFKKSLDEAAQKITVNNANGFGINGAEYYDKAVVKISTSSIELPQLKERIDTAYIVDAAFLQKVVQGSKVSLYQFTDVNKPHFYLFENESQTMIALNQYLYLDSESRNIVNVNQFTGQLMVLAGKYQPDNKDLSYTISRAKYEEDNLIDIVLKINDDPKGKKSVTKNSYIRGFAGIAVRRQGFGIDSGTPLSPFPDGKSSNSIGGSVSAGLDFVANKYTEKVIVRLEVTASYSPIKLEDPAAGQPVRHRLDIKQTGIAFIPQLIYNFYSTDNVKTFIDLGAALNIYSYNHYGYEYFYENGTKEIAYGYPVLETFMLNFPVKAGVQLKKNVQIYVGYITKVSMSKYPGWDAHAASMQFGINYMFR
ncbi:MAG: hypothetical protein JKY70_17680, partial [Mucilaginibacter sp.]|nr:hypothetical protein [Mucilaginibacter sp.]